MGSFSDTPGLIASGTILPRRFVQPYTGGDNAGAQADGVTNKILGVTDGSTRAFDSANHATAGDKISLQEGDIIEIEAGGAFNSGVFLQPDSNGKAVAADNTTTGAGVLNANPLIALEASGGDGEIVRAMWAKNHTALN